MEDHRRCDTRACGCQFREKERGVRKANNRFGLSQQMSLVMDTVTNPVSFLSSMTSLQPRMQCFLVEGLLLHFPINEAQPGMVPLMKVEIMLATLLIRQDV